MMCFCMLSYTGDQRISPNAIKSQLIMHFNTLNQFQCLTSYQHTQKNAVCLLLFKKTMLWAVEDTTNKWRCAILYRLDQKYALCTAQKIYFLLHFHDNQALYTNSIKKSNYINKNMVWKFVFKSHLREIKKSIWQLSTLSCHSFHYCKNK